ncbi:MAG TPA: hypothetical protein VG204_15545 [Terriglobia bacterium]|nr:hypothetical protein [Terriglobia bacterium]
MNDGQVARTAQDLIGRFTPTPLWVDLPVMQRTIRFETNSSVILQLMRQVLEDRGEGAQGKTASAPSAFRWRLVSDPDAAPESAWPLASIVSDDGLRYASLGQSSFVAVDLASREAVGFVAEQLTRDEAGFKKTVLPPLLSMTADALGVTGFRGTVARLGGKALLIVGAQSSDNRHLLCLAEESGFESLAGETIFLEPTSGGLRVWGASRPDRVAALGAYVFVERESGDAPLQGPLPPVGLAERFRPYLLFDDDRNFSAQHDDVLRALARLPAYCFACGSNSTEAAGFFRRLLEGQPNGKVGV